MRFSGNRLLVATHNAGKMEEISALLEPFGIEVISAAVLNLPVPDETEDSFVGNARLKAQAAVQATGLPALADDSGLTVDALNGAPGVWTADWAETPTGRDFHMAMRRTWAMLETADAPFPRRAQFRCTLVMAYPDGREVVVEGVVAGQLVWPLRGEDGHGYDPMFMPDGHDITFGEMALDQKNRISHRAVALRQLIEECFT